MTARGICCLLSTPGLFSHPYSAFKLLRLLIILVHNRLSHYITTMPIPDSSEDTPQNEGEAELPSTLSSPTPTSPTDSYGEGGSLPPSRATSQPASRSGSMSAGVGGGKFVVPQSVHVPSWREMRGSKPEVVPAIPSRKPSSVYSDKGEGLSHRFNLKDLLANGPKLNRKSSTSSKRSDSDTGEGRAKSTGGDSAVSLTQKYGVCQKVAIGKGATSVVRLAHKWDRTEEKLYAVKVSHRLWFSIYVIHRFPSFFSQEFRKRRKNESEKEYVKKLTAEFCISSTLHHPNIVETVDLVQDENQHWCEVMEFCPGGDLYAAIKKGWMHFLHLGSYPFLVRSHWDTHISSLSFFPLSFSFPFLSPAANTLLQRHEPQWGRVLF